MCLAGTSQLKANERVSMRGWLTDGCCALQWGTFLFFACYVIVETILVALLFVEPKAVPIEDCPFLFKKHWFWKRCLTHTHSLCLTHMLIHSLTQPPAH